NYFCQVFDSSVVFF
nr:immunoglobulin light chain junction region [Macaca mulatta]